MKPCLFVAALIGASFLAGCKTLEQQVDPQPEAEKSSYKNLYRGATFELRTPDGVTAANERRPDFVVHYFRVGKSGCMMGIYEGLRPRLFSKKQRDLTITQQGNTTRPNVDRGDDTWGIDSKGRSWRESIWNCHRMIAGENNKPVSVPIILHIWYFGATEDESAIFDAIVNTIEIK